MDKSNIMVQNFIQAGDLNMNENITKKEWIEFGEKNLFPQELIDINLKSSKNYSILKNLANMIKGNGFLPTSPEAVSFLDNPNGRDTIDDILDKISLDFVLSGYFCLNIVWSKNGKKIAKIKHIPFEKVRVAKKELEDESDDESIDDYFICDNWADVKKNPPQFIKGFDPNNTQERSQLLMIKRNTPSLDFYTLPHYIGAINWVRLDYYVSEYHLNNAMNGYFPSILLNIATGIPSEESQRTVKRKFDEMFKGTQKAGSMVLTFSEGHDQSPTITPLNLADSDKKFIEVEDLILQNLLIANSITNPLLVGIRTPGQIGGSTELIESFGLLQINLINSYQRMIEENFNEIAFYHITEVKEKLKISELKYDEKITTTNGEDTANIN